MERPAPAHARIYDHFSERIQQGRIETGEQLPTEADIAVMFGVSRATVQFAMSRLAWEGWIERFPGRGTFASAGAFRADGGQATGPDFSVDMHSLRAFDHETAPGEDDVTYRLMAFGRKKAPSGVSRALNIESDESVFVLERLRFVGEEAVEAESCFFPPDVFPKFDTSALDLLVEENLGFRIGRIETTIQPADADSSEARLLNAEGDRALLMLSQKHFSEGDRPVVYTDRICVSPIGFSYTTQAAG